MYSDYGITINSRMKIKNITKLLMSSCKTKIEKDLWDLWKTLYPLMIKKELKFMSFDEYKNECKGKTYSKKSYKDIQSEMLSVVKNHERGGGK